MDYYMGAFSLDDLPIEIQNVRDTGGRLFRGAAVNVEGWVMPGAQCSRRAGDWYPPDQNAPCPSATNWQMMVLGGQAGIGWLYRYWQARQAKDGSGG